MGSKPKNRFETETKYLPEVNCYDASEPGIEPMTSK